MKPYFQTDNGVLYCGDSRKALQGLPAESVHCCVTSPPYFGLRDYGHDGQIGLEKTPDEYVQKLVDVFRGVWRVLRDDGTVWLNLGDSYAANRSYQVSDGKYQHHDYGKSNACEVPPGLKPKDIIGIPWRVAFALQADGWYLRQDIIWHKPNPMPESVTDRCTKSHEYIFLLTKSAKYWYDAEAVKEDLQTKPHAMGNKSKPEKGNGGLNNITDPNRIIGANGKRNRRSVWTIPTKSFKEAHFAVFPPKLIEPCIMAGCPEGGVTIDVFAGAGTTPFVCEEINRRWIGIELSEEYCEIAANRIEKEAKQLRLW